MNLENFKRNNFIIFIGIVSVVVWQAILQAKKYIPADYAVWLDLLGIFSFPWIVSRIISFVEKRALKDNHDAYNWIFKLLIDIPNINGRYTGKTVSNYKNANLEETLINCVIEIIQTASTIQLKVYNCHPETKKETFSISKIEKIKKENDFFRVYYHFDHQNTSYSEDTNINNGAGYFDYYPKTKELAGVYFNSRGNRGDIKAKFQSKELQHKFDAADTNQN